MGLHVLITDDNVVDREAIRRFVRRPGIEIEISEAATGAEGLAQIGQGKFDCIFLDYHLPDMDGITLLRKIYNPDTDLPPFPVVMLTEQGNEAVMADALRWGAQGLSRQGQHHPRHTADRDGEGPRDFRAQEKPPPGSSRMAVTLSPAPRRRKPTSENSRARRWPICR